MTILDMTDDDLLRRMRNFEDHFVERKTANDTKDILKTIVAFANSAPVGFPAILYMGVKDSGEIETPQRDLDKLEKEVNKKLQNTYGEGIWRRSRRYRFHACLAITGTAEHEISVWLAVRLKFNGCGLA
jgi:Putative DNA-binding domain